MITEPPLCFGLVTVNAAKTFSPDLPIFELMDVKSDLCTFNVCNIPSDWRSARQPHSFHGLLRDKTSQPMKNHLGTS